MSTTCNEPFPSYPFLIVSGIQSLNEVKLIHMMTCLCALLFSLQFSYFKDIYMGMLEEPTKLENGMNSF